MEHCTPHTRAVHAAMCLEREVAGRELNVINRLLYNDDEGLVFYVPFNIIKVICS